MFELLIAFVLYEFNASAGWWYAFVAILVVDFMFAVYNGYYGE